MTCRMYTGTPGAGKSLDVVEKMIFALKHGKNVITNMLLNRDLIKDFPGVYYYRNYDDMCPEEFVWFAIKYHDIFKTDYVEVKKKWWQKKKVDEYQTLIVIDEAPVLLGSRDFNNPNRKSWVNFFTNHRHLEYNIVIVAQHDKMIDKQIRNVMEEHVVHKCLNNYKLMKLLPFKIFISITYWNGGGNSIENGHSWFTVGVKGKYYDTHQSALDIYMVFPQSKAYCEMRDREELKKKEEIILLDEVRDQKKA